MLTRRILILAPLVLIAALLQSYFWVPTYERQTTGNPGRLRMFVDAGIGDAEILNPILSADTASSGIEGLVFDGLLDLDEDLDLRGRLATGWELSETAYLVVRPERRLPDGTPVTGEALVARIQAARDRGELPDLDGLLLDLDLVPPETRTQSVVVAVAGEDGAPEPREVAVEVDVPARVRFHLARVDQDFFSRLAPVIGAGYAEGFAHERHLRPAEAIPPEALRPHFEALLPVEEHNPEIRFELRRGVRFHDGHEFDAGDVRFTYEAIVNPRNLSPRASDYEPIKAVEVVDRHTVRVVYKRLYSPAILSWRMQILPEHLLDEAARQAEMDAQGITGEARESFGLRQMRFGRNPVGTGPFRFVAWESDEYIRLRRFDDYWEGAPEYEHYYYRVIPDLLTQEVEFQTGAIDTYGTLPFQVERYRDEPRYQSYSSLGFGYSYIGYNLRRPLFEDVRVRRALAMAINVEEIIEYVLYGEGEPVSGPWAKNTDWYDPDEPPLPYDPEQALRLFEEAGWRRNEQGWLEKDGRLFEFTLITNHGNPIRKNIMIVAQNAWKRIGVKCNTQVFEWTVFLTEFVNKADFDAIVLGWSLGLGIDWDLYQLFHSSQTGPNQLNFAGYESEEADRLIVRLRREYDRERRIELAHALHRRIAADQPYTFLYAPRATRVLDKKIVVVRRDDGEERYEKIEPVTGGRIFFSFNRWRKLAHEPRF